MVPNRWGRVWREKRNQSSRNEQAVGRSGDVTTRAGDVCYSVAALAAATTHSANILSSSLTVKTMTANTYGRIGAFLLSALTLAALTISACGKDDQGEADGDSTAVIPAPAPVFSIERRLRGCRMSRVASKSLPTGMFLSRSGQMWKPTSYCWNDRATTGLSFRACEESCAT